MFAELATETTEDFTQAIAEVAEHGTIQPPWLDPSPNDPGAAQGKSKDWGRLLWLHPVYVCEIEPSKGLESTAKRLAPAFHRAVTIKGGWFVPGIGWSAIITTSQAVKSIEAPLRLLELHWAYFALYMEIDRGLLTVLDREWLESTEPLNLLEQDADEVFAGYIRVMEARARVDSELASLGGDEQAIWDAIADVQNFHTLVDGVQRKVEVLQKITERRVQQASAGQARRCSRFLGLLTALTWITVTVAVITYFYGSRTGTLGLVLRIIIIALAATFATGYFWQMFRDPSPRRKDGRRS
jgi:hypothetical protein